MSTATTVTTAEKICDTTKITTDTTDNITTTTTDTCSKSSNQTVTKAPPASNVLTTCCPCGHFDLNKLAEESRRCAFKSSNVALAVSNSIVVFTMIVLQEILKNQCRCKNLNLDTVFLLASTIATLGDAVLINNPQPFNS